MNGADNYENYPAAIVIGSNLLSVLIYSISVLILFRFGIIWVAAYLLYILLLEYRLMSGHCVDCYYFGRTCAFGKGRLSSFVFPRGQPERFSHMTITWKDILPDFLAFMIPVLAGIPLLIQEFSWTVLALTTSLFLLGFLGNAIVRGQLACRHCKQQEIGCPAAQLFEKAGK